MKRTNVYADQADLELIKTAAARRGVPEAEILREGIHLAALGARVFSEPLVSAEESVDLGGPMRGADIRAATGSAARHKTSPASGSESERGRDRRGPGDAAPDRARQPPRQRAS